MLQYTGHPLVDVGIATITAYAEKRNPSQIIPDDLENLAGFLIDLYESKRWNSVFSSVFTNNGYLNPTMGVDKRQNYRDTILYAFRCQPSDVAKGRCVFCGATAVNRCARQHIPLITSEEMVNFFPYGLFGLPVCGLCLFAVQVFPLGSVWCSGRALFVHSDDQTMTYEFALKFLKENRRFLSLNDGGAFGVNHPRTFFVARLLEVEEERSQIQEYEGPCSITLYHLTNYGTNPDIALYHFPSQVVAFLRQAHRAPHGETWRQIERRAWELVIEKAKGKGRSQEEATAPQPREEPGRARNYLYEDLFELPHNAAHFVRTYFLRRAYRGYYNDDPRRAYSLQSDLSLVSWTLTAIFLKEVMGMEPSRIDTIRRVGDRLAGEIASNNDRQLFRGLWMSRHYGDLRRVLVQANTRRAKSGKEPLLTFDDFVAVFEFGEDSQRPDWRLAQDLMLIRVIEQLHQQDWFRTHADVISEEEIPTAVEPAVE